MMSRGFPQAYVAERLGLHRNTVLAYARAAGRSFRSPEPARNRVLNALLRRFLRLSPSEQEAFAAKVSESRKKR